MVSSRSPLEQDCFIGSQPNDCPNAFQKIDILATKYNPAAGHNDRGPVGCQFAKQFSFGIAEFLLAVLFKNLCDRHSKFGHQHFVGIQTGEPALSLKRTPNRRFPGTHHPDEDNRFGRVHGAICR